nr:hypothetical protein [Tanacetum cinerariifolium]
MHLVAPQSPEYVPGPEHPPSSPSPNYVSSPEHLPSPVYVREPKYPEYLVPSGNEAPIEDQPLPADASPTALSSGYVADFDLEEDPEEDSEEDHDDYPADEGDGDDEPFDDEDDNDDADDEDEEVLVEEDDADEEEGHLTLTDSFAVPVIEHVPSAGDTEEFMTDESAPTPKSHQIIIPPSHTRLCRARKTIPSPSLLVSSPPLPLPSPPTTSLSDAGAPLGYRVDGIQMRDASPPLLLLSTSHRTDITKAEMPPRKRAFFTTPAPGFKVGESSAAGAARQPCLTLEADL